MGKMKPHIKQRWTEALRSGKYQQGKGALRADDQYCCLGVLCELAAEDGVVPKRARTEDGVITGRRTLYQYDDEHMYLPTVVQKWAGLKHHDPEKLSNINDDGASFDHIADLIDKQL